MLTHLIAAIKAIRAEVDVFLLSERPVYDSELSPSGGRAYQEEECVPFVIR